jgi:hypothetical protein
MNAHDRSNLEFLLAVTPETLKDWYSKTKKRDHKYAQKLLDAYAAELTERSAALVLDCEIEKMGNNLPDAQKVLARFKK